MGRIPAAMLALALFACGGDSTGPDVGGDGTHFLKATIDGSAWQSDAGAESFGVPITLPGLYSITGARVGGSYTVILSLYNIGATGTYPMGVGNLVAGASAIVSDASGGWATPQSGDAGTLTITALTDSRIAGTFSFTAEALSGSATGTKNVTGGSFDLEVKPTGAVGPLPDYAGSSVTATIGGTSFTAAAATGQLTSGFDILVVTGSNTNRSLTISLTDVAAPGTYALSSAAPTRTLGVSRVTSPLTSTWSSNGAGGSGSVTVTSITATRIKGTFTATLGPAPGTSTPGTLTITNGVFDIGRPPGS
jgi:hypothetical protein